MTDTQVKTAGTLSEEDLALLEYLLAEEGVEVDELALIPRREPGVEVPLSFTQQRLWFLDQLQPGNSVYNLPTAIRVRGRLDIAALEQTFSEIVRRHEILRTTFRTIEGSPQQIVAPPSITRFPLLDLSDFSDELRDTEALRRMREEVVRPFDLSSGPLMRTLVIRLAKDEHIVIVTMHHIISDGWSSTVLVSEIGALYQEFTSGDASGLADLPLQFGDYALWQREQMQGEELQSQLDYWRRHLRDLEVLELPLDHPRPAVQTFRGAKRMDGVAKKVSDGLNELARREEATMFMLLFAAFAVLLSRYAAQSDITVGTPVANRRRAELEPLIGFFANTLVLRLDTGECSSFRELVSSAREVCLGAYEHQDLPFEKLVEELRPERSLSHTPLFQTLFVMHNVPQRRVELGELQLERLDTEMGAVKFDLTLVVEEVPDGLAYTFEYNTGLFESETIARMSSHFARLLEAIVANPERRPSELTLLSAGERRQLLHDWNDTVKPYRLDKCIHELIAEQVERTPDAVALIFEDRQLTYQQLNQRANQLANYLRQRGVGPDRPVAIQMERSVEMVVALLGTLKSGAAYLPLDPDHPAERLAFMLKDAGDPVLLTQDPREWQTIAKESTADPQIDVRTDQLAYVIYTSGSTGQPKGVMIPHRGISNRLQWMQHAYQLNESDAVLQKTSYTFDVSVWEFFWPLMTGARLVVARPGGHQDPDYLVKVVAEQNITTLHFVPPMLKLFLEERHLETCTSLRRVICSGEALTNELNTLFFARLPHVELHNLYGPTEASVDVSFWQCQPNSTRRSVPIGRPIANTQLYILDSSGEPAPVGIPGELHIGGIGLARGYLNRPALTAERFIPDPFTGDREHLSLTTEVGARLYKTGDLARYCPDGNIEFLGRLDHQVKIRGYRIELPEIEAALTTHPNVQNCIVLAREDEPNEKRLVAYIAGENLNTTELRNHLRDRLPEYMVPAVFILLPELPLTTNGKIDRRALPAPGRERRSPEASYLAPRNPTEELLASIWSQVLGLDRVGVEDNFFVLGGDSIRSVRVLAQAREHGLELSLQQLFRHQTIAALVREIKGADANVDVLPQTKPFDLVSESDRARMPAGVVDAYPVTMLQGGMFFHIALSPETAVYHNVNSWHLRARFDEECFLAAVARAVARHPILRTSFDLTSYSEPLQLVHESATMHVGVTDIRSLSNEEQSEVLDQYVAAQRVKEFDLTRPPLLRFHIHRRSDESFQFTLTENHPILDGWSLTSTLSEIFTNYFALLKGQAESPTPPPNVTFRDFVLMERQAVESEEHRAFWRETLRDLQVTRLARLPAHYRGEGDQRIRQEYVVLPPEVCERLHATARDLKVPLKSLLLAAHMKVLSVLSGERDIVSGLVTNGRPEALDGEEVRGLFLNTLPFRLRIPNGSWSDLIRATFEAEWELLPHRRYPLPALQREMGGQPLFEAQFNYVHFHVLEGILGSGEIEFLPDKKRIFEEAHFPLTAAFGMNPFSTQISLMLQYDALEVYPTQVQAIAGYFAETFKRIADSSTEPHDTFVPLTDSERRQLLVEWNDTARDYPSGCLHEMFEAQVAKTPHAEAVISDNESLTYSELNSRSNQVARHLTNLGVKTDARVAILLKRSVEMVLALLGILKAGAAYVPLDPDYPTERLRFMLDDCGASVVLTDSQLAESLSGCSATIVCIDDDDDAISQQSEDNLEAGVTPDNLAYVIYTSGSTGQPKGAMLPHSGIVNCIAWMQETYNLAADDRFLCKTSLNFDASVWEIFWPLNVGASLMVARHDGQRDGDYLAKSILRHGVTAAYFVPSMLTLFIEEPLLSEAKSLRQVICGGESLPAETVERFYSRLAWAELHHSYGPTETSIAAAEFVCPRELSGWQVMPLGRPVGNNELYILDRQMEAAPIGVTGELYIGGAGLARGYHGLPSLTAEKFIPNPFSTEPGARLYRTGDLARYLPDGLLEFRGRTDSQIKLRGMRIELGEIEAGLRGHPDVDECVVVMRGQEREADLVAYVIARNEVELATDDLRSYLAMRLPRHMVPSTFVMLEQLPLMVNGKVDRRALPDPSRNAPVGKATFVAPATELERTIAGIWSEVLGREEIGTQDNFFDLGGHSLRLLLVHLKLRETIGIEMPLFELFQYPTVSALATHLNQGTDTRSLHSSEQRGARRKQSVGQRRMRRDEARAAANRQ